MLQKLTVGQKADIIAKSVVCAGILALCTFTAILAAGKFRAAQGGEAEAEAPAAGARRTPKKIVTMEVAQDSIGRGERFSGEISNDSIVKVFPYTGGRVTRICLEEGQRVAKGQVIAYVDPSKPGLSFALSPVESTVSGTITKIEVKEGEMIQASTPVASVGSLDSLKVTVNAGERHAPFLKAGQKAFVMPNGIPDERFAAHVTKVSPIIDPAKRTFEVTLAFDKKDSRVRSGMFASVEIAVESAEDAVVVPEGAVSNFNGKDYTVYVVKDGIAQLRKVERGVSSDGRVQILSGLSFGEVIVAEGTVKNGTPVNSGLARSPDATGGSLQPPENSALAKNLPNAESGDAAQKPKPEKPLRPRPAPQNASAPNAEGGDTAQKPKPERPLRPRPAPQNANAPTQKQGAAR